MPDPPRGEADLRALSERFSEAERRIRALIARAQKGDRRGLVIEAIAILITIRRLDFGVPVITAYLDAFHAVRLGGAALPAGADDLAGSLAKRLDGGVQTATANAREAFGSVTEDNLEEVAHEALTAHVDTRGTRGPWTPGRR
jgi:hypothetical protein